MPNIITVTPHTAIDHVIHLDELKLGETHLARENIIYPAGKGINVAKALESLGQSSICLGFVGKQSKEYYQWLSSPLLQPRFAYVSGRTRSNITLISDSGQETHIRTSGYQTTTTQCQALAADLGANTQPEDIVILSGSLPPGAPTDFYALLIDKAHSQGAQVFLDSSGEALKVALRAQPDLIKPNQLELEELMGQSLPNETELVQAASVLIGQGIKQIVISRGSKGALLVTSTLTLRATVAYPFGPIISSIGCGDALLGGLAFAALHRYPANAQLKLAVACGTANLFSSNPGKFDKKQLNNISQHITLERL